MKSRHRSWHHVLGIAAAGVIGLVWPSTSRFGVESPKAEEPPALWLAPATTFSVPGSMSLASAVSDLTNGRAADAVPALARAAENDALGGYGLLYLGRAQLALNRLADARASADRLIAAQPGGYLSRAALWLSADVAEAAGEWSRAAEALQQLTQIEIVQPERAHYRLGVAASKTGDLPAARRALETVYYEYPLSALADDASAEIVKAGGSTTPTSADVPRALARAQELFDAKRYVAARAAFTALAPVAADADRSLVELRLGQCDYYLERYAEARDRLRPLLPIHVEAEFFYLSALRGLGQHGEYVQRARAFVEGHPAHQLSQETLNNLATHFILVGEDAKAAEVFAEAYRRYPAGLYAERAAWKSGWWKYRNGAFADAVGIFESAAATFPKSDSRPAWMYWAARAHQRLGERELAVDGFKRVIADYRHSYYGRQAVRVLTALVPGVAIDTAPSVELPASIAPGDPPPNAAIIRTLLSAGLYDAARMELRQAEIECGRSPLLDATVAYTLNKIGDLRGAIIRMRAAYPQIRADGGEQFPVEMRRILYPLAYWDVISRHATNAKVDPYLMAALIAQESTFQAGVKSSAGAWGLMQIMPATGRLIANRLKIRPFSTARLTQPEVNVRIGVANFAGLLAKYDGDVVPVLAGYNAGDTRVSRWLAEKPELEQDEFIDDIPYPETQNYVKRILGSVDDYRMLYGNTPLSLVSGPPPSAPAPRSSSSSAAAPAAKATPAKSAVKSAAPRKAPPAKAKAPARTTSAPKAAPKAKAATSTTKAPAKAPANAPAKAPAKAGATKGRS